MSLFASCLDLLDRPTVCPGCRAHAPRWSRVSEDGLTVLTHDGDLICPADAAFGASPDSTPVSPPLASPPVVLEVAA
ncbi:hypothetical protein [Streptomyces sp. Ag109_G2-15]|uniref:hypothetical protein n=1 Tax=Streptomyces sp. Ag109_G2-15 TaxID=1938850 RepID=UPI000BD96E40|nr:hypothetical protein [Streptomyces sp. Ag109_G2-15]SOD85870.1 hypothetical protein SAMN06272765_3305 [Streptomyces sp. Ag109_G2-15]